MTGSACVGVVIDNSATMRSVLLGSDFIVWPSLAVTSMTAAGRRVKVAAGNAGSAVAKRTQRCLASDFRFQGLFPLRIC